MGNWTILNDSQFFLNTTQVPEENNFFPSTIPLRTIVRVTLCSIGILANSLIIFVIIHGSLRKSVFMNLLMTLAIFDSLFLMAIINIREGIFGQILVGPSTLHCSLSRFLNLVSGLVSSWITVLISIERFIAIYYPFKVHIYCTKMKSCMIISSITIFACLSAVPFFYISKVINSENGPDCQIVFTGTLVLAYRLVVLTFYSIVPFFIVTIFNILMIKKLRVQKSFVMKSQVIQSTRISSAANKSHFVMMVSVCLFFVVTSFPCTIAVFVTYSLCFSQGQVCMFARGWLFQFTYILDDMNHSLNLFVYCLAGSVFRCLISAIPMQEKTIFR